MTILVLIGLLALGEIIICIFIADLYREIEDKK
jgi:hypothetical protein